MTKLEIFEVGGCVRDELLGLPVKDIDYTVVGPKSFDEFLIAMRELGFHIWDDNEDTLTIRAQFPVPWDFAGRNVSGKSADIVLARKESGYSDGRHPDFVNIGTLEDDLARRDFTINALVKTRDGEIIDMHNGLLHLEQRVLVAIGGAKRSFTDDALRAVRALRFRITKDMWWSGDVKYAMQSDWLPPLVQAISFERRMEELDRMFKFDNDGALMLLSYLTPELRAAIFSGYRLTTTNKKVK